MKKASSRNISYSLVSMLLWLSYSYVCGYAAAYLMKGGFSSTPVGILLAAASLLAILLQTLAGFICDRRPRFDSRFFLCLFLMASVFFSFLLCFLFSDKVSLGICFGLLMSVQFSSATIIYALANEYMNHYPFFRFGPARALGSLVSALGMSIMGFILEHFAPFVMPFVLLFLNLACFLITFFLLPGKSRKKNRPLAAMI